jgi:hypothetical protein
MPPSVRDKPLPTAPIARAAELIRRSAPSPDAPSMHKLPPDVARAVADADRERAILYAQFDDASDRCYQLAAAIEASGVVVDVIDPEEDDSLVTSLDGLADAATAYGH